MKTGHDKESPDILDFKVVASGFLHVETQLLNMVNQVQFSDELRSGWPAQVGGNRSIGQA